MTASSQQEDSWTPAANLGSTLVAALVPFRRRDGGLDGRAVRRTPALGVAEPAAVGSVLVYQLLSL